MSKYRIPLAFDSFAREERDAIIQVLDSGRYTQGQRVLEFEKAFAAHLGVGHAVMVNSGSSANLLAVTALRYLDLFEETRGYPSLGPGDEVIIQAQCWPTTLTPILNAGAHPVLCDIDPGSLNASVETVERVRTDRTRAVVAVPILGNPAWLPQLRDYCRDTGLVLLEDACESLGAIGQDGGKVGTYGLASSFSFYFSHHITTVEGGAIATDSIAFATLCRALRDHGWVRNLGSMRLPETLPRFDEVDDRYCFFLPGYNVRPTEFAAALGLVQLEKLQSQVDRRRQMAHERIAALKAADGLAWVPGHDMVDRHSWMAFPLMLAEPDLKRGVQQGLEARGVETRPVIVGNILNHPMSVFLGKERQRPTPECDKVFRNGLMLGMSPFASAEDEHYLREALLSALAEASRARG